MNDIRSSKKGILRAIRSKLVQKIDLFWKKRIMTDMSKGNLQCKNKLRTYREFKESIHFEPYLLIKNKKLRSNYTKLRTSNHNLKSETDRRNNKNNYVPYEQRYCKKCNLNKVENEYHFLTICPLYKSERESLYDRLSEENKFFLSYSDWERFLWMLTTENTGIVHEISEFITKSVDKRKTTPTQT
jgi:hypothetical protein